jgi:hypothetical protein
MKVDACHSMMGQRGAPRGRNNSHATLARDYFGAMSQQDIALVSYHGNKTPMYGVSTGISVDCAHGLPRHGEQ